MKKIIFLFTILIITVKVNGQIALSWEQLRTGVNDKNNPTVKALVVKDTNYLFAGGDFLTADSNSASHIAEWNNITNKWNALGSGVNNEVTAIADYKYAGIVVAGGAFDTAGGIHSTFIAQWDGSTWGSLRGGGMNGQVYALATDSTVLYAGGSFTTAGGDTVNRIAMWNGTVWSSLGSGFDSNTVYCLAIYNDTLYAGGSFTKANGKHANYIAKWNGTFWDSVGTGMNNTVYALAVYHNTLFAGGAFTKAGGITANYIAQWNGKYWSTAGIGMNDTVRALCNGVSLPAVIIKPHETNHFTYFSTVLFAGGSFTNSGGTGEPYFGYWDGAWEYYGSDLLNHPVYAICTDSSYWNYFGGMFDSTTYKNMLNHVAKFYVVVGSGINELSDNSNVTVFPNPSTGILTIQSSVASGKSLVEIYNMLGERVYATTLPQTCKGALNQIDLSNQPTGVYFYRLISEKGEPIGSGKLVIE